MDQASAIGGLVLGLTALMVFIYYAIRPFQDITRKQEEREEKINKRLEERDKELNHLLSELTKATNELSTTVKLLNQSVMVQNERMNGYDALTNKIIQRIDDLEDAISAIELNCVGYHGRKTQGPQ